MTSATLTPTRAPRVKLPPGGDRGGRRRRVVWLAPLGGLVPLLALIALVAGAGSPPCTESTTAPAAVTPAAGAGAPGMFAAPLTLTPGRWFRVGATRYGGPSDPSSGSYGASGAYLPALPDSFAELSVLDTNPASTRTFTFQDANALGNLPYGTAIRIANGPRQQVLIKRDIGYGQGPGQTLPYRIDVWWHAADALAVTKVRVAITLAPADGTAGTLDQLPSSTPTSSCTPAGPGSTQPLALTSGEQAQIASDGSASAPAGAPAAVKLAIAAANQIHTLSYPQPDVHYGPLPTLWPAYDCSGSVSYVLYKAGLHSPSADVSGSIERWGQPGPGRWITVYANSTHTFIDIAGRAFDTANYGGPNLPTGGRAAVATRPDRKPRRRPVLHRPSPPRPMTTPRHTLIATLTAVTLAGCGITDPYHSRSAATAASSHTAPATTSTSTSTATTTAADAGDPATERGGVIPPGVQAAQDRLAANAASATPQAAVERYANLYVNWRADQLADRQRQLASISSGQARAQALQAAASTAKDPKLTASHVANHGQLVSIAPGTGPAKGQWVIVTTETTTGQGAYTGLPPTVHVTYATLTHRAGGWVISQWSPQS